MRAEVAARPWGHWGQQNKVEISVALSLNVRSLVFRFRSGYLGISVPLAGTFHYFLNFQTMFFLYLLDNVSYFLEFLTRHPVSPLFHAIKAIYCEW